MCSESDVNRLTEQNSLSLYLRVRYSECDAQGIVFNARYADYADVVDTEYFRILVGNIDDFNRLGFDKRVVHFDCQWTNPARVDDVLKLTATVIRVGTTSYTVKIQCEQVTEHELVHVATITITYVVVSLPSYKKTQIPQNLRTSFMTPFHRAINQSGADIAVFKSNRC